MDFYIRRPLLVRGHQAAESFLIVSMLLSLYCFKFSSFPCILHSLLVSSFLSKFYSCNVSMFLCCYRAHRSRFSAPTEPVPSAWDLPGYPSKIIDFQTCSQDPEKAEESAQGTQKATKKTSESRLEVIQFTKYLMTPARDPKQSFFANPFEESWKRNQSRGIMEGDSLEER